MTEALRQYVVMRGTESAVRAYSELDREEVKRYIDGFLDSRVSESYKVVHLPSLKSEPQSTERRTATTDSQLLAALVFDDESAMRAFRAVIAKDSNNRTFFGAGIDLAFAPADLWYPGEATDPIFGDRRDAHSIIGAQVLHDNNLNGQGVNVVVIDEGLRETDFPQNYADGWNFGAGVPGQTDSDHARMIARNVLSIAPHAKLFDCPILPPRISNVKKFAIDIHFAYKKMLSDIALWRQTNKWGPNWIFVNAWAVYDRRSEASIPGDYTNNPAHPFNITISDAEAASIDLVFSAGNCGQFCPNGRCGPIDRGPGDSIHGANSHSKVLTVGAARSDGRWLGYSSQGPGQSNLDRNKPDLCAPSQFSETYDANLKSTGTSAACAIAAGIIAALRSRSQWSYAAVPPSAMKLLLNETARQPHGGIWDRQLGHGIIDAGRAYNKALALYP